MPHMINKDIVAEMQRLWPQEWDRTTRNRFRSGNDMQYGFSYFYYLMYRRELQLGLNKGKKEFYDGEVKTDLIRMVWEDEVDTDRDGILSQNELVSLASLTLGDAPQKDYLRKMEDCLVGVNRSMEEDVGVNKNKEDEESLFETKVVTFEEARSCSLSFSGMQNFALSVAGGSRHKDAIVTNLDEVAFQMIGDDYNDTKKQLDSVRARRPKFICINDNMENPSEEVIELFQDFLKSFFPKPSRFELPPGVRNIYLRWEDYERVKSRVILSCDIGWVALAAAFWYIFRRRNARGDIGGRRRRVM